MDSIMPIADHTLCCAIG